MATKRHIERLSATTYYGHPSPGQVVLANGHIVFHGEASEARKFEDKVKHRT